MVVISEFKFTFNCTAVDFVIIFYMYFCFVNETLTKAQTFMNYHEITMKSYFMITHSNIPKNVLPNKEEIDREANKFAKSLDLDERMECYSNQSAFITLKDNKANFKNNTKCRLINPSKSEVGLVSKYYLNSIISIVAEKSGVNQWRNTSNVIK